MITMMVIIRIIRDVRIRLTLAGVLCHKTIDNVLFEAGPPETIYQWKGCEISYRAKIGLIQF